MAVNKNGIVVLGAIFVDIKGSRRIFMSRTEETQVMWSTSTAVSAETS